MDSEETPPEIELDGSSIEDGGKTAVDARGLDGVSQFQDAESFQDIQDIGQARDILDHEQPPSVALPPAGGRPDYQLGGAYPPPAGVTIVGRDRGAEPADGLYSICYINGFQTQPGELDLWPEEALLYADGEPVADPDWPDEVLLDTSSESSRAQIFNVVKPWIEQCASSGFQAVEFDNLDTYTRSAGRLRLSDNTAMAALFVEHTQRLGLAAAQKNAAEDTNYLKEHAGFDFAVAEECAAWQECDEYTSAYGESVIDIEYPDNLPEPFHTLCEQNPEVRSMVLRDRNLRTPQDASYIFEVCQRSN